MLFRAEARVRGAFFTPGLKAGVSEWVALKFFPNLYPEIAILFGYYYKSAQSINVILNICVDLRDSWAFCIFS
jgi:hypothetical protein